MVEIAPLNSDAVRIRAAVEGLLRDKTFRRAPVMSRLLQYLADQSLDGKTLKSYTIATDALGRDDSDGSEADTYARVAVARLRKTLASYYAANPAQDEVYVDTESYAVLIRDRDRPVEGEGEAFRKPDTALRRLLATISRDKLRTMAACMALLLLLLFTSIYFNWKSEERWLDSNFPTVQLVDVDNSEVGAPPEVELDAFSNLMRPMLAESFGFRLIEGGEERADYEITLDVDAVGEDLVETVTLIDTASGRVVWTEQYPVSGQVELLRSAQLAASAIAAPDGVLNDFGRRKGIETDTPYGCWLRFTGSIISYSPAGDGVLTDCAEDWYAADPASRTASFLRNWTMVDASLTTLIESRRRAELEAALDIVHEALARDLDNGMLYIGEMRTYSFLGIGDEVRQAAKGAIAAAPDNRVVVGMAGTWLTFWNDPMGPDLLTELDAGTDGGLPWEHAGHFVAAMMKDDPEAAGRHLAFLRFYMDGQPALNLLEAAYCMRVGKRQDAEAALDSIRNSPRALIAGPDEIMQRLPISPEVRARLGQWLEYDAPGPTPQAETEASN